MGPVIAVASLAGAPGVSTLAVALAGMWPSPGAGVVVESNTSGGDVAAWRGLSPSPGVAELAAATRQASTATAEVFQHSHQLPGGLWLCPAPPNAQRAQAPVELLAQHPEALSPGDQAVCVLDLGRLTPQSPAARLAQTADAVVLLTQDEPAQLKRLHESVAGLGSGIACLGVVLAGTRESATELAELIQTPVWARIPRDRRGAAVVKGHPMAGRAQRRPLLATARQLGERLMAELAPSASSVTASERSSA